QAADLVEDRVGLERVVALHVLEAVRPGAGLARVGDGRAGHAGGGGHAGQGDDGGVDLGRVVVVDVARVAAARARDRGVGRVLVRPGGVAVRGVDHAVDRVGAHEIPRVDGRAAGGGVARQAGRVDREDAAVHHAVGAAAVEPGLVEVDAFLVLGGRAVGHA